MSPRADEIAVINLRQQRIAHRSKAASALAMLVAMFLICGLEMPGAAQPTPTPQPSPIKAATILKGPGSHVIGLAFSADGTRLVATYAPNKLISSKAIVWDLAKQEQICVCQNPQDPGAREIPPVADRQTAWLSLDGKKLILADPKSFNDLRKKPMLEFQVWDTTSGKLAGSLGTLEFGYFVGTMSPDGKSFAVGLNTKGRNVGGGSTELVDDSGKLTVWDLESLKLKWTVPGIRTVSNAERHPPSVSTLTFSPDGTRLGAAYAGSYSTPGVLKLWSTETGKETATFQGAEGLESFNDWPNQLRWLPDGKTLIVGTLTYIESWETAKEQRKDSFNLIVPRAEPKVEPGKYAPPVHTKTDPKKPALPFTGNRGIVRSLLSADGNLLVNYGAILKEDAKLFTQKTKLEIWDVNARGRVGILELPDEPATRNAFTSTFRIQDSLFMAQQDHCIALSRDGKTLAIGDRQGVVRLFEVAQIKGNIRELSQTSSASDLPEALQSHIDKCKSTYQEARQTAEKKLLEAFESEIDLIRNQEKLKAESKEEAIKAVEAERTTFEKNSTIPFSPRMRTGAINYLKTVRLADVPLAAAYEKGIDYFIKTKRDDSAGSLLIGERKKMLKTKPVGVWECTGASFKGTFTWTLYADGTGEGPIVWLLEKDKLIINNRGPGSPPGGFIDTCVIDAKGQTFTAKNQKGGVYTGKRVDPP